MRSRSISKTLLFTKPISQELVADEEGAGDVVGALPIYDEHGTLLGYVTVYATTDAPAE